MTYYNIKINPQTCVYCRGCPRSLGNKNKVIAVHGDPYNKLCIILPFPNPKVENAIIEELKKTTSIPIDNLVYFIYAVKCSPNSEYKDYANCHKHCFPMNLANYVSFPKIVVVSHEISKVEELKLVRAISSNNYIIKLDYRLDFMFDDNKLKEFIDNLMDKLNAIKNYVYL